MGNYVSCALANVKQSKGAKVILPTGEIKEFLQPTKAAELMLEIPNYFVVNTRSLQIGRRFSPLNADEDLNSGDAYVMFPMKSVNSVVSAGDLGAIYIATRRGGGAGKVRVVPATSSEVEQAESAAAREGNARGLEEMSEFCSPEVQHRRSVCRSRKPTLETIAEEPICS